MKDSESSLECKTPMSPEVQTLGYRPPHCRQVALSQDELKNGLPIGYVLCDGEYVYEVLCEDCRRKYLGRLKIYDSLDEAGDV